MPVTDEKPQQKGYLSGVGNNGYEFTPQGDTVTVRFTHGRHCDVYTLPVEEARALWRKLRKQGYEVF